MHTQEILGGTSGMLPTTTVSNNVNKQLLNMEERNRLLFDEAHQVQDDGNSSKDRDNNDDDTRLSQQQQ